jgi:thymidine kinase
MSEVACHVHHDHNEDVFKDISPGYMGRIEVIMGPMFAGKTTEMLRRVKMYRHAGKRCLVLKSKVDDRHKDDNGKLKERVITHDGYEMDAVVCEKISDAFTFCVGPDDKHEVIAIDEGQFFPDLAKSCDTLANYGRIVLVACLSGSFERKFFGDVDALLPLADKVSMVRGICSVCRKNKAPFTKVRKAGSVGPSSIKVGGSESYVPVCRQCYFSTPPPTREDVV